MSANEQQAAVPPHNDDAEQAVLGGLLIDNTAIDRMPELPSDAFYRYEHRLVHEQILRLVGAGRAADVLTVHDALQNAGHDVSLEYLNALATGVAGTANIARYAEIVIDQALRRQVLAAADVVQGIVHGGGKTGAEMLDAAQAEFGKLDRHACRKEPVALQVVMARYVDELDARYHGHAEVPCVPTGLRDLDDYLGGGLPRGGVTTLGARPGMGKSALAQTITCNSAGTGKAVAFFSMEMPEREVAERGLAIVGKLSAAVLRAADKEAMDRGDFWPRLTWAVQQMQDYKMFIDDDVGLTLLQVAAKARALKRRHGLDLLVLDYLQLMTGPEEKRYQQIEAITKGLKVLAKTLDIAVLALSQFSRDIEKRLTPKPKMSDFRDGGGIEADSDVLLGLYREEQDNPDTEWKGTAEVYVLKQRQGRVGKIALTYTGECFRFDDFNGVVPAEDRPRGKTSRKGFDG